MLGRAPLVGIFGVAACASSPPAADPLPVSASVAVTQSVVSSSPPTVAVPVAISSAPPPACTGTDQRLYGSTCCRVTRATHENRFPGQTFLSCVGPQVGKPCTKKGDCDIACSCDADDSPRDPRDERSGPKDGTKGLTGFCSGRRQAGVWMCDIDENGVVSHVIVD